MYYELYVDIFFLVNFLMDIMILSVANKTLKCQTTWKNICLGALTGSVMTCVLVFTPVLDGVPGFIISHGLISLLMTRTGLRIQFHQGFWKAYITVYISAFLLGGVLLGMRQYIREGSIFLIFTFLGYLIVNVILKFVSFVGRYERINCDVLLVSKTNQIKVKALIDTGNRLFDTVSKRPVSIISKSTAKALWQEIPKEGVRYIPYRTIQGKGGVLPMLVLEKICLYQEKELWISEVCVAICEENIGTGEYDMILNPNVR